MIYTKVKHPTSKWIQSCLHTLEGLEDSPAYIEDMKSCKEESCVNPDCIYCEVQLLRRQAVYEIKKLEAQFSAPTVSPKTVRNISISPDGKTDQPVAGSGAGLSEKQS